MLTYFQVFFCEILFRELLNKEIVILGLSIYPLVTFDILLNLEFVHFFIFLGFILDGFHSFWCAFLFGIHNESISSWQMAFIEWDLSWGDLSKSLEELIEVFVCPVLVEPFDKQWWLRFKLLRDKFSFIGQCSANLSSNLRVPYIFNQLPGYTFTITHSYNYLSRCHWTCKKQSKRIFLLV